MSGRWTLDEDHSDLFPLVEVLLRPEKQKQSRKYVLNGKKHSEQSPYHCLWVFDMADTHALDLFRRQQAKLDLLDGAQRRARMFENKRHD